MSSYRRDQSIHYRFIVADANAYFGSLAGSSNTRSLTSKTYLLIRPISGPNLAMAGTGISAD